MEKQPEILSVFFFCVGLINCLGSRDVTTRVTALVIFPRGSKVDETCIWRHKGERKVRTIEDDLSTVTEGAFQYNCKCILTQESTLKRLQHQEKTTAKSS